MFIDIVEYFNHFDGMITNDARHAREIKSRITLAKAAFNRKTFHQQIGIKFEEKLVKCCIWSIELYGADSGALRTVNVVLEKCHGGDG